MHLTDCCDNKYFSNNYFIRLLWVFAIIPFNGKLVQIQCFLNSAFNGLLWGFATIAFNKKVQLYILKKIVNFTDCCDKNIF